MEGESEYIMFDGVTCKTLKLWVKAMLKWEGSTKYDIITTFMCSSKSGKFKTE